MNLRKDHSHASNNTTVNSGREVLLGDGDASIDTPLQKLKGGRAGWVLVTSFQSLSLPSFYYLVALCSCTLRSGFPLYLLQLSAIDVSARTTMKGAAKCDKHCELQDSVNQ